MVLVVMYTNIVVRIILHLISFLQFIYDLIYIFIVISFIHFTEYSN